MHLFNRKSNETFRRHLRKEMTVAEKMLWKHLRNRQRMGYKFRRQAGVGDFIVDFYCPARRLVIEVDGDSHFETDNAEYDALRQAWLESQGLSVLRCTDLEIRMHLEDVIERIDRFLHDA